jgi:polyphenol oxidase
VNLIFPDWPANSRVRAFVTTRALGDMALGAAGREAVRKLVPADPVWMKQVHGIEVLDAGAPRADTGDIPVADAAVCRTPRAVCAVTVADCMPVFLADEAGSAVAVAHAGWRGLCAGVLEASLDALDVAPKHVVAWLGPAIGPRVYEVGDEVRQAFIARDRQAQAAFAATRPGHWLLDLYAVARQRLEGAGVRSITGGDLCTHSDAQRFFSFRRDGSRARMAALIWLA